MAESLENLIRRALKHVPPPSGLEEKILARVGARRSKPKLKRWLALAATFAMITSGLMTYRHYQKQKAKAQLVLALQITSKTLNYAFETALNETQEHVNLAIKEKRR
jgi:hypothetical protein